METLVKEGALFVGRFHVENWRRVLPGDTILPDDKMVFSKRRQQWEWRRLVWEEDAHNLINNEGLDRILNVVLHGTAQTSPWYCCLVETDTTPASTQNYDVPVYTESTSYDEATRPEYNEAASSSQSITNSANKAVFTISATKTMYGASIVSISTKGDHTGGANNVLLCYAKFASSRSVLCNDIINLTYSISAADDAV